MAARSNAAVTEPAERVLVIERVFDAQRELVFKCWTKPEHLARWIGPRGFSSTILACELRQGGNYRMRMRGPDGQDRWHHGVFREIVPPERIVRTYYWTDAEGRPTRPETLLTVTFADLGERTCVTLHQAVFESVAARDEHQRGWSSSLDKLAEYIATL
jgi:uncharacterized protein YndB with AHSA1/START domain